MGKKKLQNRNADKIRIVFFLFIVLHHLGNSSFCVSERKTSSRLWFSLCKETISRLFSLSSLFNSVRTLSGSLVSIAQPCSPILSTDFTPANRFNHSCSSASL